MAFATVDNTTATTGINKVFAKVVTRIQTYLDDRKELKALYRHNTAEDARLAGAQRDVNRVWHGQF